MWSFGKSYRTCSAATGWSCFHSGWAVSRNGEYYNATRDQAYYSVYWDYRSVCNTNWWSPGVGPGTGDVAGVINMGFRGVNGARMTAAGDIVDAGNRTFVQFDTHKSPCGLSAALVQWLDTVGDEEYVLLGMGDEAVAALSSAAKAKIAVRTHARPPLPAPLFHWAVRAVSSEPRVPCRTELTCPNCDHAGVW